MFAELAGMDLQERLIARAGQIAAAQCQLLVDLAEFDATGGFGPWECRSAAHWLMWRCGEDTTSAWDKLRVARALGGLRVIREAFSRGEVSFAQVRDMVRVATPETESELLRIARAATGPMLHRLVKTYRRLVEAAADQAANARRAGRFVTLSFDDEGYLVIHGRLSPDDGEVLRVALEAAVGELASGAPEGSLGRSADQYPGDAANLPGALRADALVALAESALAGGLAARHGGERTQVVVHVDAATLAGSEPGGHCELAQGPALAPEQARRLACDASLVSLVEDQAGQPLSVGRRSRAIPAPLRRALAARDGGCQFPGCSQTRFVEAHHIRHWAQGGETSLDNTVLLCWFHHRHLHEGGYSMVVEAPGSFRFLRPGGEAVAAFPARTPQDGDLAIPMDPRTTLSRWDGSAMDYGWVLEGFASLDPRLPREPIPKGSLPRGSSSVDDPLAGAIAGDPDEDDEGWVVVHPDDLEGPPPKVPPLLSELIREWSREEGTGGGEEGPPQPTPGPEAGPKPGEAGPEGPPEQPSPEGEAEGGGDPGEAGPGPQPSG